MAKINVLPKHIADLIAAGEVVERPASVIKELMENAIDAGATSITVEIKHGGVTYMRVTDDGSGILREDIRNAFKSHATSKILTEQDLTGIGTLGFRGEALASIAAVSRVSVLTRTPGADVGTVYKVEGSEEILLDDAGCPEGTTIVVEDIFFNTPARMKFLKKDVTEGNSVAGVVDRIALSHPEVSIRFIRDDRQQLVTPGNGAVKSTVYSVFGKDFSGALLDAQYELNGVKVEGLVSKPTASRSNRSMQFFFLNGRLVKSGTASAALERAYKDAIMVGKFPACVLYITVDPETVDVNVHPAKTEVRFSNEHAIFDAVYYAAKNAIIEKDTPNRLDLTRAELAKAPFKGDAGEQVSFGKKAIKDSKGELPEKIEGFWSKELPKGYKEKTESYSPKPKSAAKPAPKAPDVTPVHVPEKAEPKPPTEWKRKKEEAPKPAVETPKPVETPKAVEIPNPVVETPKPAEAEAAAPAPIPYSEETEVPEFRIIGEAYKTFILVETEGRILYVDKHAAHERILYDKLIEGKEKVETQLLLVPVTVSLSKEEYNAIIDSADILADAGFVIDDFGPGTVAVRECPTMVINEDMKLLTEELAGCLLQKSEPVPEKLKWMYKNIACRAAIKGGDYTPPKEQEMFIEYVLSHRDVRYCPHGRPILIELTRSDLEKQFGRIQLKTGPSVRNRARGKKK